MVILQRFHNRSVDILRTEEELRSFVQPVSQIQLVEVSHGSRAGQWWICRWVVEDRTRPVALRAHCQVELPLPACPAGAVCQPCLRPARPPNTLPPPPPAAQLLSSAQHSSAVLYRPHPAPATTPASPTIATLSCFHQICTKNMHPLHQLYIVHLLYIPGKVRFKN